LVARGEREGIEEREIGRGICGFFGGG